MSSTIVLQSHSSQAPNAWLAACMQSVADWASVAGFDYKFEDDALFERLPNDLRQKTACQPVVATDIARLLWVQEQLAAGYKCVVWMDADMLILDPSCCRLPTTPYAVGREVWIQAANKGRGWRSYKKVHNAFLMFRQGNSFLEFYLEQAIKIVRAFEGEQMVPQLVGPKLLTALHNVVGLPVAEWAGMLSPAVALDVLAGGGAALERFRADSDIAPAALNLCGSSQRSGELSTAQLLSITELLTQQPI